MSGHWIELEFFLHVSLRHFRIWFNVSSIVLVHTTYGFVQEKSCDFVPTKKCAQISSGLSVYPNVPLTNPQYPTLLWGSMRLEMSKSSGILRDPGPSNTRPVDFAGSSRLWAANHHLARRTSRCPVPWRSVAPWRKKWWKDMESEDQTATYNNIILSYTI